MSLLRSEAVRCDRANRPVYSRLHVSQACRPAKQARTEVVHALPHPGLVPKASLLTLSSVSLFTAARSVKRTRAMLLNRPNAATLEHSSSPCDGFRIIKLFSLLLRNCHFATVTKGNVSVSIFLWS